MIKIHDNILEPAQFDSLKGVLTSSMFPWYYVKDTALEANTELGNNFSFHNTMYDVDQPQLEYGGPLFELSVTTLRMCLKALNMELKELHRIRMNLYTRNHEIMIHHPHVDDDRRESKIGLLYITSNFDSPTLIFNEVFNPQEDINNLVGIEGRTFNIKEVVHSVENRFAFFDGNRFHSSTRPTKEDVRININYNFTVM